MENLYLVICPVYRLEAKTASHYQEFLMSRLIRSDQNIWQLLPCTLRWAANQITVFN